MKSAKGQFLCAKATTIVVFLLFLNQPAWAFSSFKIESFTGISNPLIGEMIEFGAVATHHRDFMPASPEGFFPGLDVGVSVGMFPVPSGVKDALAVLSPSTSVPSTLPVPKISLHKGLLFGFNLGLSFLSYKGIRVAGGSLQWTFYDHRFLFNMAIKAAYSSATVWFVDTKTVSADIVFSRRFLFLFEPYLQLGWIWGSGDMNVPSEYSVPVQINTHHRFNWPRVALGFPIKLGFIHVTGEYSYLFSGQSSYGAKVSLNI